MTLQTFMETLKSSEIKVTLISDDSPLIKFYSDGYSGIESDVLARIVRKWEILSATAITVTLEDVAEGGE